MNSILSSMISFMNNNGNFTYFDEICKSAEKRPNHAVLCMLKRKSFSDYPK